MGEILNNKHTLDYQCVRASKLVLQLFLCLLVGSKRLRDDDKLKGTRQQNKN